jgi:hypothetical protein
MVKPVSTYTFRVCTRLKWIPEWDAPLPTTQPKPRTDADRRR